jgi:hypothetical protein
MKKSPPLLYSQTQQSTINDVLSLIAVLGAHINPHRGEICLQWIQSGTVAHA